MYHNIPMELRERLQWVVAGPDKIPLNPRTGQVASVTDPGSWASFNEACARGMRHIGFVLTAGDPYCIIDLDNKPEKPLSEDEWKVHERILQSFESYTERSASGRGYHIVTRGRLEHGRRRGNVEVYSDQRYMIFTGDIVRNLPIVDCQPMLEALVAQMPSAVTGAMLEEVDGNMTDLEVHEMAMRAANGGKYDELCRGDWQGMGYPSQSEADFALLSIFAFYTRDNEQVRRLFRGSNLGKRDKAQQDNRYLDTALRKIRSKEPAAVDFAQAAEAARAIVAAATPPEPTYPEPLAPAPAPVATSAPPAPTNAPARARAQAHAHAGYTPPPGLVGELAQYFHSTAVRPLAEAALVTAIGIVAGVCGRSFNVSGTGLNQYLLFIGRTGTGKEAMAKGISKLIATVRPQVPMIEDFIGPSAFASGQGLIRTLDSRPCFVSILGEFGLTLQALSDPRAPAAVTILRKVLLDLYGKSGWEDVLRSTAYSDQEKNTKAIHAPAVTILGESTPETFYDGLDAGDIADGLIPRFHVIEYKGTRPARNRNAGHAPSPELASKFAELVSIALTMQNNHTCANVQIDARGLALLDAFDEECDSHMRTSHNPGELQLWNRAHLKALKLSALLAVGCGPHAPVVTEAIAQWAIDFTRQGTEQVLARFFEGDVGQGEAKQTSDLRRAILDYLKMSAAELEGYKCSVAMQKEGIVPYRYLVTRLSRTASFYRDRNGTSRALQNALATMVKAEILGIVHPGDAMKRFNARQELYYLGGAW